MRVLVATVVHHPLDARIHHRQIRALVREGVTVTELAPWTATGTSVHDAVAGVRAVDVPRAVGRRRLAAAAAARDAIADLGRDHDLVLLHDPELIAAVRGRRDALPPIVLDVHEDLAASVVDRPWIPTSMRTSARRGAARLERWAEDHLHLLLAEAGYRDRFRRDHPVVENLPWLPEDPLPAATLSRVVQVGRLSAGRGIHELLAVARALHACGGPHLELVGPADREVRDEVERAAAEGVVTWHGFLPNDEALTRVEGAVAGLALLHDLPNYRSSLPTKVVEYLAHGVPAITTPLPAAVARVAASDGGVVVPFGDVPATVGAILALAAEPARARRIGAAGRAYVAETASWDHVAETFVEHLRELAGTATRAAGPAAGSVVTRPRVTRPAPVLRPARPTADH